MKPYSPVDRAEGDVPPGSEMLEFDPYDDEVLAMLAEEVREEPRPLKSVAQPPPLFAPQEVPAPPAPAPQRVAPPVPLTFEIGDSVEIARRLESDIRGDSQEPLVFDEGSFWLYEPASGVYQEVDPVTLRRTVAGYSGLPVGEGKQVRPLSISDSTIKGAVAICADLCARNGFFHDVRHGVAFRNAFVSLESGKVVVKEHSPAHRARHALPFEYDAQAPCPRWQKFLSEIFTPIAREDGEVIDDGIERAALIQEFIGGALFGISVRLGIALVLLGDGANGKSVLLKIISRIFPTSSLAALAPQEWKRLFSRAELMGKILNVVSEMPSREISESDIFKAIVTGDTISAERKYKPTFTFAPKAAHLFACNALPVTRDQSRGYWRRFQVVVFDRKFEEFEQDAGLADVLMAELPGIAAWVIEGARRLLSQSRYTIPRSSELAKAEWQKETDQIQGFVEECVTRTNQRERDPSEPRDRVPRNATPVGELYDAYTRWAARAGHHPTSKVEFGRRLSRLLVAGRCSTGRYYFGCLNPQGQTLLDLPPGMRGGIGPRPATSNTSDTSRGRNL